MGDRHTNPICLTWGGAQLEAIKGIPQFIIEAGIGYPILQGAPYRVYESYAWQHFHMGKMKADFIKDWFSDAVIHKAFEPEKFNALRNPQDAVQR